MSRKGWKAYEYSQDEAVRLLFPPVHGTDLHSAAAQVQGVCYRSPQLYDLPRSRWSLALLQKTIPWLAGKSLSCISQLLKRVIRNQAAAQGISEDEALRQFTSNSPLGRIVQPGDIAAAAVFLASDKAASITGEDLNVSTGTVMY